MRPSDIDYTSREKHYFDISNGELLIGENQRLEYLDGVAELSKVVEIGELLRVWPEDIDPQSYERLNASAWLPEQFRVYGSWLQNVVLLPSSPQKAINMPVLRNAARLGVGHGTRAIRNTYTTYSNFYIDIKASSVKMTGQFDDWELKDFVAYIKRVGGKRRPTGQTFDRRHKLDPSQPPREYMRARFSDIGGFIKLLELAGYPVVELWDEDDYINWGVKAMEANDGTVTTSTMANYYSRRRLGPGHRLICDKFGRMSIFQRKVFDAYTVTQQERQQNLQEKIDTIDFDLQSKEVPLTIFNDDEDEIIEVSDGRSVTQSIIDRLGIAETFKRYAKYKVLQRLNLPATEQTLVSIAKGATRHASFEAAIRDKHKIPAGEIEYTALYLGVFDDIWPMDSHMRILKLGSDYEKYYYKTQRVKTARHLKHLQLAA